MNLINLPAVRLRHMAQKARTGTSHETFGQIVRRIKPSNLSLAKLFRTADVDYAYYHSIVMRGERDGKPLFPSPEGAERIIRALRDLGATVSTQDEEAMIDEAVRPPEGYRVIKSEVEEKDKIQLSTGDVVIFQPRESISDKVREAIADYAEYQIWKSREGDEQMKEIVTSKQ